MDTLLLDHPHKHDCLNLLYKVEPIITTRELINTIMLHTIDREYIHNVYKLPSIEPTIRHLQGAAEFPVEETLLKSNLMGRLQFLAPDNITNVAHYFPESEETQKGLMSGQQWGVRSTE
jgi:hypothetical protein